jgi:integrase
MSKRRDFGSGSIEDRGANSWRLRYRISGRTMRRTVRGSKTDAMKTLRQLLHAGDTGEHVDPSRTTLREWVQHWLSIGAPSGNGRRTPRQGTVERYERLLHSHLLPKLGNQLLQRLQASEIDTLYASIGSAATAHYLHIVLTSCLASAERTRKLVRSPMRDIAKAPQRPEANHGRALSPEQLRTLLQGFRSSPLYALVCTAALTGMRRNEILSLTWRDLNIEDRTITIERALEGTRKFGLRLKPPKSERGKRTIAIGDELTSLLLAEREKHLRLVAGVPDGVDVDLSLVKLPDGCLIFPNPGGSLTDFRQPTCVTRAFRRTVRRIGFAGLRFHDLRGSCETALLDAGVALHVVAARGGHDAAVLMKHYAKRTRDADVAAAAVTDQLGILAK